MARTGRPKERITKGVGLKVHPEAWVLFNDLAVSMGLTRSQLVEKIAWKQIVIQGQETVSTTVSTT